jgi:hypothetical protein
MCQFGEPQYLIRAGVGAMFQGSWRLEVIVAGRLGKRVLQDFAQ